MKREIERYLLRAPTPTHCCPWTGGHAPWAQGAQTPPAAKGLLVHEQQLQTLWLATEVHGQVVEAEQQVWGAAPCACCLQDHTACHQTHFPWLLSKGPEVRLLQLLKPCSAARKNEEIISRGICGTHLPHSSLLTIWDILPKIY